MALPDRERAASTTQTPPPESTARMGKPRSLAVAAKGIRTADDFANYMSALMSDLIEGTVAPPVGHAACNAGGKLLKVVELQMRYGAAEGTGTRKTLRLTPE